MGHSPHSEVIPNGREPARFKPRTKENFIFAAGRLWDEAKNMRALAAVASDLAVAGLCRRRGNSIRMEPLRDIRTCKCSGGLPAWRWRSWFARAPIYALPAHYEPFGLSALEAGLAGCALVLGDIPSLREIWGEAALVRSSR